MIRTSSRMLSSRAFRPSSANLANILTLNVGSSSLKYSVMDVTEKSVVSPLIRGNITIENGDYELALNTLASSIDKDSISAVSHRIVHGGTEFSKPTLLTPAVLAKLAKLSPLAPLHNPPALATISLAKRLFEAQPHVAVFDTSFHSSIPARSFTYAIPKKLTAQGIRKYGFHGTVYEQAVADSSKFLGKSPASVNLICVHLGSGCSVVCVKGGVGVDTSMGFTPTAGLVMGTRSGDLDPSIPLYLQSEYDCTAGEVSSLLNKESGLKGLTGVADMEKVARRAAAGEVDAVLAREIFVSRVRGYIGAYLVELKGECDAIVMSGGISENDSQIREAILKDLSAFGISLNKTLNDAAQGRGSDIEAVSSSFSKTKVLVVKTDEEKMLALHGHSYVAALPVQTKTMTEPAVKGPKLAVSQKSAKSSIFVHSVSDSFTADEELGLLYQFSLKGTGQKGYFRPFARSEGDSKRDFKIELMRAVFGFSSSYDMHFGVTTDVAEKMIGEGREDEMMEIIIEKYQAYKASLDGGFVLASSAPLSMDPDVYNARVANTLNLPCLLVADSKGSGGVGHLVPSAVSMCKEEFDKMNVKSLGVLMSSAPHGYQEQIKQECTAKGLNCWGVIPSSAVLSHPTLGELKSTLGAELLFESGGEKLANSVAEVVQVMTTQVDFIVKDFEENKAKNRLIVTHVSRTDALLSLLLLSQAATSPISGIVLTGYKGPSSFPSTLNNILSSLRKTIPVLVVEADTFETVFKIDHSPLFILPTSTNKITEVFSLFKNPDNFDDEQVEKLLEDESHIQSDITSRLFQHMLNVECKRDKRSIVLPEGTDRRIVLAASELQKRGLALMTLIGEEEEIREVARANGADLTGVNIINPAKYEGIDAVAEELFEKRKHKGMTMEEAAIQSLDHQAFATLLLANGTFDGMVSGAAHSSASVLRSALQIIKMAPNSKIVSSVFFMLLADKVYVYGDCAINVDPTSSQLSEIAIQSVLAAKQFGIQPRVGMISFATGDSNKGPQIDKVINATSAAKERAEEIGFDPNMIYGPIQFDAAVDVDVAKIKFKGSTQLDIQNVGGNANVIIFSDLGIANTSYKAVQRSSKCVCIGPMVVGLNKPVNDLSRGSTVEDIVNTVLVTCIQAQGSERD